MILRKFALALVALLIPTFAGRPAHALDTNIKSYVCAKLDDFSAKILVVKADKRELAKINRDAGMFYQFSDILMRYKEPRTTRRCDRPRSESSARWASRAAATSSSRSIRGPGSIASSR